MENKPTTPSGVNVKAAAPAPTMEAPIASVPPIPAVTPSSTIPNPIEAPSATMAEGGSLGSSKNGLSDFFNGWNWLEIGLMTLGVAGVFYTINYYRFRVKADKT